MLAHKHHGNLPAALRLLKNLEVKGTQHPVTSIKDENTLLPVRGYKETKENKPKAYLTRIFTITFSYLQKLHRTKVLKVHHSTGPAIYKVVLSSKISSTFRMCWLQHQQQGWIVLLGGDFDENLIRVITAAIKDQE